LLKHAAKDRTTGTLAAGAEKLIPISPKAPHWHLHFGPLDKLHRAVGFKPMPYMSAHTYNYMWVSKNGTNSP